MGPAKAPMPGSGWKKNNRRMSAIFFAIKGVIITVAGLAAVSAWTDDTTINGKRISLLPGFHMAVYAQVPGARTLTTARELGAIFVGTQDQDIYAILDPDLDGNPGQPIKIKSGLNAPHGVAWHGSHLYVAERDRVLRFRGESIEDIIAAPPEVLFDRLPNNPHHGWRYAAVGPDNNLYVSVGAPCNICRATGYEGTIVRLPITGGEAQCFARGVRNSVGLDFQPKTGVLYFTDNGADNMGAPLRIPVFVNIVPLSH
jgi:glucose/arabinose dehydrogenase